MAAVWKIHLEGQRKDILAAWTGVITDIFGYSKDTEEPQVTSRFLARATGRMKFPFTGKSGVGGRVVRRGVGWQ